MAETVVINIEANTQGLQDTITLLTKLGAIEKSTAEEFKRINEANMANLSKASQSTVKEFEKVNKAVKDIKTDNTLAKSLDVTKEASQAGNGIKSLKAQLKEATIEAQNLADAYGELDPRTVAAAKRAGELKDKIGDVNNQINALSPEGKFKAIQNLGGAIAGVFQVATGALQAFGVESEAATKIAQQFQGALNIFAGLSQLGQFKDSLVAVQAALGLTTAAKTADTEATVANAEATAGATVTQTALNRAVLANPYVIAAAAVAALAAAVYAFVSANEDAAQSQENLNEAIARSNSVYEYINKNLDQRQQLQLAQIDQAIELAEIEGKTSEEIIKLQEGRIAKEREFIDQRTKANQDFIDQKTAEAAELKKLGATENADQITLLNQQIDEKTRANQELFNQDSLLDGKLAILRAKKTKDDQEALQKRENDQIEHNKRMASLKLENQLAAIKKKYDDERIIAYNTFKDKEGLEIELTRITQRELQAQLELYKTNSKEYQDIKLKLAELAARNPIQQAVKFTQEGTTPSAADEPQAVTIPVDYEVSPKGRENLIEAQKKLEQSLKELADAGVALFSDVVFGQISKGFEDQIDQINKVKEEQLAAISEEESALQSSYENRRISKRELEDSQKKIVLQRIEAEKKAERELNEIRRKQAIAQKASAIFDIAVNTARSVMAITADVTVPVIAKPVLIAAAIALGGIQTAAVLAQPLPKFKKGTLSVPGVGSEDTVHAMLQPGEAVIPTETNRKYKTAVAAIYNQQIKPEELNSWVTMRLKNKVVTEDVDGWVNMRIRDGVTNRESEPVKAKLDTADLYSLSRLMKRNDGVYVKNIGELATLLANQNNPRR